MNGKGSTGLKETGRHMHTFSEVYLDLAGKGLHRLSRSVPKNLLSYLRAQFQDYAGYVSRLAFILTIVTLPWRLRLSIRGRPQGPIYGDYTDFLLFLPDIMLLATLSSWLLSLWLRPRPLSFGPAFITSPLAGLTLMGLLSVFGSVDPALSVYHSIRLLLLFGFYLYILNEVGSIAELALPAGLLVFPQAVVGILQVLEQHSINLHILGEYALDPSWSGVSIAWANGTRFLRAYGLSDHPNILGGCLVFALLILSVRYATSRPGSRLLILSALFTLGGLALLVTLSRSAWLAFLAGSVLGISLFIKHGYLRAGRRWFSLGFSSLILLIPFLLYTAPYLGVRLGVQSSFIDIPSEEQSLGERQLLNATANQLFSSQPLTGVGLGAFPVALKGEFPDFPVNYQPAHLALLDAAAETGIFGALFYALLLFTPWLVLWFKRRQIQFTPSLIGASALLLAVSLLGFFDYYTWLLVPGRLLAWLSWGVWGSVYRFAGKSEPEDA
jgi:O-antigen ligase